MNSGPADNDLVQRALAAGSVPSLSALAVRLVELAADDSSGAQDLARVIEQDPGLTARLLRLVNSPALRRGQERVSSITRAVVLLGLREIRIMALSLSLRDTLPLKRGSQDFHLFWRASLHRAVLAQETARRLALPSAEEAFAAGLLLELGLPLTMWVLGEEEARGFPGMGAPLKSQLAWERRSLGADHRVVGRELLRLWGLPAELVETQQVVEDSTRSQAGMLTEVADFARRATEAFFLPDTPLTDIYQVAWRRFGLGDEAVNQVLAGALLYVGEAAGAMDIKLDQDADLLAVMEKANAALSRLSRRMEPAISQAAAGGGAAPPDGEAAERTREEAVVDTLEAVAHEIRNPLMSVGGFARRLIAQMGEGDQARRYAEVIASEAARLDAVLAEMVAVAAPYSPGAQALDLAHALREAGGRLEGEPPAYLAGRLPQLRWRLPAGGLAVAADPAGLVSALRHLLAYGASLLEPGARLTVHLGAREGRAVVSVLGPGSPRPVRDHLSGKHFGPELGLAQARRVAEAHGGYLSVGSNPRGRGFVLTFSLPAAPAPTG
jgi:HD-like signal output (HDOD) protein